MFEIKCDECGKDATVPFKPKECLSSLKKANLFTVAHASRNEFQRHEEVPI